MQRAAFVLLAVMAVKAAAQDAVPAPPLRVGGVVDLTADVSAREAPGSDTGRFVVRGVELGMGSSVGAGWTAAIYGTLGDDRDASIVEAYATRDLSSGVRISLGRRLVPSSIGNTVHVHAIGFADRARPHQALLGAEGAGGTGIFITAERRFASGRAGLDLSMVDRFNRDSAALQPVEEANRLAGGLGYALRARAEFAVGASRLGLNAFALTSRRAQPLDGTAPIENRRVNAVLARQSALGAGLAVRSGAKDPASPAARGGIDGWATAPLTTRWIVRAEAMVQLNEDPSSVAARIPANPSAGGPFYAGPDRDFGGFALEARARAWRALDAGLRFASVEDPAGDGARWSGVALGMGWASASTVRFAAIAESASYAGRSRAWRLLAQAVFSLGEHPAPH